MLRNLGPDLSVQVLEQLAEQVASVLFVSIFDLGTVLNDTLKLGKVIFSIMLNDYKFTWESVLPSRSIGVFISVCLTSDLVLEPLHDLIKVSSLISQDNICILQHSQDRQCRTHESL